MHDLSADQIRFLFQLFSKKHTLFAFSDILSSFFRCHLCKYRPGFFQFFTQLCHMPYRPRIYLCFQLFQHMMTNPVSGVIVFQVAAVRAPGLSCRFQIHQNLFFFQTEQRADPIAGYRFQTAKTCHAGSSYQMMEHRLRKIVLMMGESNFSSTDIFADRCKTAIPCDPSSLFQTDFFSLRHSLHIFMKYPTGNPFVLTKFAHKSLIRIRLFSPQLMMHMHCPQGNPPRFFPSCENLQQTHGICPSGNTQHDRIFWFDHMESFHIYFHFLFCFPHLSVSLSTSTFCSHLFSPYSRNEYGHVIFCPIIRILQCFFQQMSSQFFRHLFLRLQYHLF